MLDLVQANRGQLIDCGIPDASIDASGLCTVCREDDFFSHRGSGGVTGRQINFLMLKGDPICKALLLNDDLCHIH
jgi:copper oxidase (laccase) domain-containing protein